MKSEKEVRDKLKEFESRYAVVKSDFYSSRLYNQIRVLKWILGENEELKA